MAEEVNNSYDEPEESNKSFIGKPVHSQILHKNSSYLVRNQTIMPGSNYLSNQSQLIKNTMKEGSMIYSRFGPTCTNRKKQ